MKSPNLNRLLIMAFSVLALMALPTGNRLFAQPVFHKIEVPEGRAGQIVDLQVKGSGLSEIKQIDKVKFDGEELEVIHFEVKSDERLLLRIRIPENAQPGEHKISIHMAEEVTQLWLAPDSAEFPEGEILSESVTLSHANIPVETGGELPLEFRRRGKHSYASEPITLSNTTSHPLKLGTLELPLGVSVGNRLPPILAPGESVSVSLLLENPQTEKVRGHLRFTVGEAETFAYRIAGKLHNPPFPKLQLRQGTEHVLPEQTTPLVFDPNSAGSASMKTFSLQNNDSDTLRFSSPQLPAVFELVDSFPQILAPGDTASFTIKLSSDSVGTFSGNLQFEIFTPVEFTFSSPIIGTVSRPLLPNIILSDGKSVMDTSRVSRILFYRTKPGEPAEKSLTITNRGTDSLRLKTLSLPPGLSLADSLPDVVPPKERVSVTLQINLGHSPDIQGSIILDVSNGIQFLFRYPISAQTGSLATPPLVFFAPGQPDTPLRELIFDSTRVGTPVVKTFSIKNNGRTNFTLLNLKLPPGFSTAVQIPTIIPPGGTGNLVIRLDANSAHLFAGRLHLEVANGAPHTIEMGMRGVVLAKAPGFALFRPPWIWVLLITTGLGVLFSPTLLPKVRKQFTGRKTGKQKAAVADPSFYFEPQVDPGLQRVRNNASIKSKFEMRVKPVTDFGQQYLEVPHRLLLETESILASTARLSVAAANSATGRADDLTRIEGIGPRISALLYDSGILTYRQLAESPVARLSRILNRARLWMTNPATWPEQAALAAEGRWKQLNLLQKELKGGRRISVENR